MAIPSVLVVLGWLGSNIRLAAVEKRIDSLETKMDTKFERLESKMEGKFGRLEAEMDAKFDRLESKMDRRFDGVFDGVGSLRERVAVLESEEQ